jgi:hypothetical protein
LDRHQRPRTASPRSGCFRRAWSPAKSRDARAARWGPRGGTRQPSRGRRASGWRKTMAASRASVPSTPSVAGALAAAVRSFRRFIEVTPLHLPAGSRRPRAKPGSRWSSGPAEPTSPTGHNSPIGFIRQRIESIVETLKDQLTLERHSARTPAGLLTRITAHPRPLRGHPPSTGKAAVQHANPSPTGINRSSI